MLRAAMTALTSRALCVLALVVVVSATSPVVTLDASSFGAYVGKSKPVFVEFYAP